MSREPTDPEGPGVDSAGSDADSTLAQRTITAAQWQFGSSLIRSVLQFGVTVLLARLLTPEDFGLVALALIVVAFADMVVDLGLGPAIVQREVLTDRQIRAAFTVSTLIGAGVMLAVFGGAPLFASLMRSEEVAVVLRWQSLIFILVGLSATARALLERRLDFRGTFFMDLVGYGFGYAVFSVALAMMGYGVWSLVWGSLLRSLLQTVVSIAWVRHSLRPLLAARELRDLLNFGFGVILNRAVVYISYNGDNFVVGRWLGPAALGLYNRAFQLMQLPLNQLGDITWSVLFSAYSKLQNDRPRAARAYLKGVQLNALAVAPIMAGMIVAGPHLVVGLYGPQWEGATLALQLLCAVGLFRAVFAATGALTHAFGEVYAEFRRQAVYAVLLVGAVLAGVRWGLGGAAFGVAVATLFMYLAMGQLGIRITGIRWSEFFAAQLPGVALALGVGGVGLATRLLLELRGWGSGAILLAVIGASTVALPILVYLLPGWMRPVGLYQSLESGLTRLPARVRLPIRAIMHLSPEHPQVSP